MLSCQALCPVQTLSHHREEFLGEAGGGGWLGGWVLPVLIQPHPCCQVASPLPGLFPHL